MGKGLMGVIEVGVKKLIIRHLLFNVGLTPSGFQAICITAIFVIGQKNETHYI
jgi:hypothetical protein